MKKLRIGKVALHAFDAHYESTSLFDSMPPRSNKWWGIYQEDISKEENSWARKPFGYVYIFEIIDINGLKQLPG